MKLFPRTPLALLLLVAVGAQMLILIGLAPFLSSASGKDDERQ